MTYIEEELFRSLIYWFVVSAIQEKRLDVVRSLFFVVNATPPSHSWHPPQSHRRLRLRRCGADAERRASHHRPHHHILLRPLARSLSSFLPLSLLVDVDAPLWLCLYVPIGYERNGTPSPNDISTFKHFLSSL